MRCKSILIIVLIMFISSIFANNSIADNYLKNRDTMNEIRKTRRISLEHFKNIGFFFLMDSINCGFIELENFDFKEIELKSKVPVNQLVTLIAGYEGKQRVVMLENSNELVAVDYNELTENSVNFNFNNNALTNMSDLNKEEILLSFFINNPFNFAMMNYREKDIKYLTSYLEQYTKQSTDIEYYNILPSPLLEDYQYKFSNHFIPANSIRKICRYQYERIIENKKLKDLLSLLKKIALDENIPNECKTMYTNSLLYNYLEENKDDTLLKKDYFDYVLKVLNESPILRRGKFYTSSQSDTEAMKSLFRNTQNNKITARELFLISKQILEINKNPIISLQAYCGIQYYYLNINDLKNAFKTAIESIMEYNKPILCRSYKEVDYFNAKPALMYLDYLMEIETQPNKILHDIDNFIELLNNHPEFQNFMVYRKAIVKDFFSYPLEHVILTYEQINTNPKNYYVFDQPFSHIDYTRTIWKVETDILPNLRYFEKYSLKVNQTIEVKKNILSIQSKTITLDKDAEVIIHSHTPYLLTRFGNTEYYGWKKGEIDGEIFWIDTK